MLQRFKVINLDIMTDRVRWLWSAPLKTSPLRLQVRSKVKKKMRWEASSGKRKSENKLIAIKRTKRIEGPSMHYE